MILQLTIGSLAIISTVIVQVIVMKVLAVYFRRHHIWLNTGSENIRSTVAMVVSVLWLVMGITINTWAWAIIYMLVGEFDHWEPALYYAISSFTTLGYGDIVLSHDWRILGALSAVNGLIIFGLNTAFLIELMIRTWGKKHGL